MKRAKKLELLVYESFSTFLIFIFIHLTVDKKICIKVNVEVLEKLFHGIS